MQGIARLIARVSVFVHHHLLGFLVGGYILAALAPAPGLWIRGVSLGEMDLFGHPARFSLPSLMLSLLLFNAGLGVQTDQLRNLARSPFVLVAGLLANLVVPLAFILGMAQSLKFWHNPTEVQYILVGLALVASMPVAGSSTAWSQNARGDLVLSLGLVILSTCSSPLTTPAILHAVGWVAEGTYADCLYQLADNGTSFFLLAHVLLPSLLGIAVRGCLGEELLRPVRPAMRLVNSVNLLLLCYSNAALALPETVADPDWDFLGVLLVIVLALCVLGFAAGWLLAWLLGTDEAGRTSLMFGLGMNNNGTGLVLAGTALAHLPNVMLPVLFYNLVQHLVAALTDRMSPGRPDAPSRAAPEPLPSAPCCCSS
jgi:BASS family bile acid:Na+ symporter